MPITTFETVEQFWSVYSYILPSQKLPNLTDLHLFKEGISPLWEHESNKKGCHLKIFVRKQITQRLWENLVLAFLGEQFMLSEEICGIVLNIRKTDTISIWLKTTDPKIVNNIGMTFFRTLNLPIDTFVRCNLHQEKSEDVEGSSKLNIISLGVSGIKVEIETSSDDWKKITNFEQLE